jgi:hypothetical protein
MSPNRIRPALALTLALVCAWLLAACGGSDDAAPPPPAAFTAETKSGVIGTTGGAVTLTLADGTVFDFAVPAGAVKADTTFVLTTQEPIAGQRFHLRLQPEDLVFAQGKAATLLVTLPAGQTLGAKAGFAYRGKLVPFAVLPDGRLQIDLTTLTGVKSKAASIGRAGALAARQPLQAPSAATCGGPELGADGEGGLVAVDAVEAEVYGQCMVAAIQALAANEQFFEAVTASQSVASFLLRVGSESAESFRQRSGDITCLAESAALARAADTRVDGMGKLYEVIKPILFWERIRLQLGSFVCPGIGDSTYVDAIDDKVGQAIVYYESQKSAIVDTHDANYQAARTEAAAGSQATAEVLALNPEPGLRATLDAQVVQRAQPSVLDALLQAPWARCRNDGSYDDLVDLLRTLDSPPAVQRAAQYCATQVNVASRDKDNLPVEAIAPNLGGISAASLRARGDLYVPKDGKLTVSGPVGALKCPSGSGSSDEALLFKLAGVSLQTMSPPYLGTPLQIDVASALQTAGLDAAKVDTATLTIERIGTTCGGFWGDSPTPLVTIELSFKKHMQVTPTLAVSTCVSTEYQDARVAYATDLWMPFGFAQSACANSTHATALTLTDPDTLVWSEDAHIQADKVPDPNPLKVKTAASGEVRFLIDFPKAGTLTITFDLPTPAIEVCFEQGTPAWFSRVNFSVVGPGIANSLYIGPCADQQSTATIAISAGDRFNFYGGVGVPGGRDGSSLSPSATLRFVATP